MPELVAENVRHGMLGIIMKVVVVRLEWASVVIVCSDGGKLELKALFPPLSGFIINAPRFVDIVVVPQGSRLKGGQCTGPVSSSLPSPHCIR